MVALPTTEPVWVVFERDDVLSGLDRTSALQRISGNLARADPETEEFVRAATRRRIFRPLPILPPPDDTIYAIRLFDL